MNHLLRTIAWGCLSVLWALSVPAWAAPSVSADERSVKISPFVQGSMADIKNHRAGRPFIVSLWSIDCPSCYKELTMWRSLKDRYPELEVVLISTDAMDLQGEVVSVSQQLNVEAFEAWQFANAFQAPLRYEIDPQWGGELPRTYFYSATGESFGRSGVIESDKVETWLNRVAVNP